MENLSLRYLERLRQDYFTQDSWSNIVFNHSFLHFFNLHVLFTQTRRHSHTHMHKGNENISPHWVCPFNKDVLAEDGFVRETALNPAHPAVAWPALCACISSASSPQSSARWIPGPDSLHQRWWASFHWSLCCEAKWGFSSLAHPTPCATPPGFLSSLCSFLNKKKTFQNAFMWRWHAGKMIPLCAYCARLMWQRKKRLHKGGSQPSLLITQYSLCIC